MPIKALKNNLSVNELQKLLGQWRKYGITDSVATKLLGLYLGMTPYMDSNRTYRLPNFYDLALSVKFRNCAGMLQAVRQSRSFIVLKGDNLYGIDAFCSPLWNKEVLPADPTDENALGSAAILPAITPAILQEELPQDNNIYNINNFSKENNPSENPSEEFSEEFSKETPEYLPEITSASPRRKSTATSPTEEAKLFFHLINSSPEQKKHLLTPLITRFQQLDPGLSREEACQNLVCLVNEHLVPHFASQPRFLKTKHAGRTVWLINLLKSAHGQSLLKQAAQTAAHTRQAAERQACERAAQRTREEQRSNHPLSPHEWTDSESGMRFYDDDTEGTVLIPAEAIPRPSATSVWNVLSSQWVG